MIYSRPSKRVKRSSSFAILRELPRLGTAAVAGVDDDNWMDPPDTIGNSFTRAQVPTAHPFSEFVEWRQHDATILGCKIKGNRLTLSIGRHDYAQLFGSCHPSPSSWEYCSIQFPSDLQFSGVQDFQILRIYGDGAVQRIRASQKSLDTVLDTVRRVICVEWTPSRKRIIVEALNISGPTHNFCNSNGHGYGSRYIVCVDCEFITVREKWRRDWIRLLGESKVAIFDAFQSTSTEMLLDADDFDAWVIENDFGELLGWELPDWFAKDTEV